MLAEIYTRNIAQKWLFQGEKIDEITGRVLEGIVRERIRAHQENYLFREDESVYIYILFALIGISIYKEFCSETQWMCFFKASLMVQGENTKLSTLTPFLFLILGMTIRFLSSNPIA